MPPGQPQSRQAQLARLGLRADWDFVLHLPLRYKDETRVVPVAQLRPGTEALVQGQIVESRVVTRGRRQLLARLADDSGELLLRFLHFFPSQLRALAIGNRVRAFGTVRGGALGALEMVHPRLRSAEDTALPTRLTPIYPTTEGLPQQWLRARITRALRAVDLTDPLPAALRAALALPPLAEALQALHAPPAHADAQALSARAGQAWRRIKFDELLAQQISLRQARQRRGARCAPPLQPRGDLAQRLLAALPFRLTAAQQRVWAEVEADLASGTPMQRLVQGDVGSGKTVIAALAAARAIEAGYQAALMAPTEILAEQHFRRIAQWLDPLGVQVAWLAGKLKSSEKRAARAAIAEGRAQLVIGTHALVQDGVQFARLGLAIIDEQHRFGVAQRLALRQAAVAPHLLMLSATPIPRTLAMTYFADLDVSVIDELPPGRVPVVTKLVAAARRDEVLARVRDEVAVGRQAYWVCPLVNEDGSAQTELTAATETYAWVRAAFPTLRVGLLHGQLPAAEKHAVMQTFAAGALDILVATTVIEVGVDVPNASLMVIEHAQRFGLAQLHQLRGRVGRAGQPSYCVLLYDEPLSEAARARLRTLYETNDGFEIARRDLQLRGPGEFLGRRQSGVPLLRYADLEHDADLVEAARTAAAVLLRDHPLAAQEHVRRWLGSRTALAAA
ncbi:MAG: ATP-dependent DNA helicase RecG [Burkholderiaceae bacterium]|nr:ATP-dependent DNA helicase RecG [Burkholderiaceae bacterium]